MTTAITTYDTLVQALVDALADSNITTRAPMLIGLAEAMFNRRLDNMEMEESATALTTSSMALPSGFSSLKSIFLNTDPRVVLTYMTPDDLRYYWGAQATGQPVNYSLIENEIVFGPSPDTTYTVDLTYIASLTALSSTNQTNWLLTGNPDLYFYASLMHAEFFGWNDDRLPVLQAATEQIIGEINKEGLERRYGGRMRMRPTVIEII
jgi:hypothetical protein